MRPEDLKVIQLAVVVVVIVLICWGISRGWSKRHGKASTLVIEQLADAERLHLVHAAEAEIQTAMAEAYKKQADRLRPLQPPLVGRSPIPPRPPRPTVSPPHQAV